MNPTTATPKSRRLRAGYQAHTPVTVRVSQLATDLSVVERNDSVWGGKTMIRGTRIPVFVVRSLFDSGESPAQIAVRYPSLSLEKVLGALYYSEKRRDLIEAEERDYEDAVERLRPR